MRIGWVPASQRDLTRLYDFLKNVNPRAAGQRIRMIVAAAEKLPDHPRVGHRVEAYAPREVRSLFVSDYELHYEVLPDRLEVLRVWHMREDR